MLYLVRVCVLYLNPSEDGSIGFLPVFNSREAAEFQFPDCEIEELEGEEETE